MITDLEQAQSSDFVQLIECEAVVEACWYNQQISWEDVEADPLIQGMFCRLVVSFSIRYSESLQTLYTPHTSKKPDPERMYCISSYSCLCLLGGRQHGHLSVIHYRWLLQHHPP